ncbi:hypothetical protein DI270_032105 [Microbispora triticiradicis]|uniref:Uncharacterized protein n=1 Tax=Microbispora triticiradicis TaxID=2200763 RepID=A0ABX9LAH4_9ACTN|nr:hypothetical protein [Microbispora triticiradicis]RGA00957.1 hypothetical protein DI270_032105 [Microbispora triticiradicis]
MRIPSNKPVKTPVRTPAKTHRVRRSALAGALLAAALLAGALFAGGVLGPAGTPAQAATTITASLSITRAAPPGPGLMNVRILVKVPMNLYDANGYLNNGARIELRFYGEDPVSDNLVLGPITYVRSAVGLSATEEGIRLLTQWQEEPGSWLNEDDGLLDGVTDEVYVRARFVDGDGVAIQARSNVVTGIF